MKIQLNYILLILLVLLNQFNFFGNSSKDGLGVFFDRDDKLNAEWASQIWGEEEDELELGSPMAELILVNLAPVFMIGSLVLSPVHAPVHWRTGKIDLTKIAIPLAGRMRGPSLRGRFRKRYEDEDYSDFLRLTWITTLV